MQNATTRCTMSSSYPRHEGDSPPIDDIRSLLQINQLSLRQDDVHSFIRAPIYSSLIGAQSQPSYVVSSSSSETPNALQEHQPGTANVAENTVQVPRLNHQPMNISLILNPDKLPELPISTDDTSTNLEIGRYNSDSCPAASPGTPSLGSPMAAPTLQASLKQILNEPSPLLSPNNPAASVLQGPERSLTVPALLAKPESTREISTTGSKEFAKQRSIHGTKLITSYFSPSQSPITTATPALPKTFTSANALQQLEISTLQSSSVPKDATQSAKRLLPAFSDDVRWQPREKRVRLDESSTAYTEFNAEESSHPEAMQIDDHQAQGATSSQATTPAKDNHHPPLQCLEDDRSLLDDKQANPDLSSPLSKSASYKSQVDTADEMIISDDDEDFLSNSESFDEYDPYFDTLETPKRKPIPIFVGERISVPIPILQSTSLADSTLVQQYQRYELMTDKGARKPYMSKRARDFLSHLGDFEEFNNYRNEIIHVDFTAEEVDMFRNCQAVPGRTREDCIRFQEDYPDLLLDYGSPCFIRITSSGSHRRSHSDYQSLTPSFSRQRQRTELGVKNRRSDRELQTLLSLIPCSTFNHASGDVIDLKFSPVNNQFAVCCNTLTNDYNRPGNLLFGDATREIVSTLNGHADRTVGAERYYTVSDIRFSNDGQYLYSGSYDNTVKIWDMKGEMLGCLTGHGRITALSTTYCSDRVLAVASDDGNVYLYDVLNPSKQRRTVLQGLNDRLCGAFLVPGQGVFSNWMLAGYESKDASAFGALYAYDVPTGKLIQRITPASNSQSAAYFHPSANHFVVGATGHFNNAGPSAKSVVRVFDPRTDKITMEIGLDSPQKDINKVTLSPCGFRVTSGGTDGKTFVWDLRMITESTEPEPLHILAHGLTKMVPPVDGQLEDWDTGVSVAEWLPQSDYLMTGASDGCLKLWDTRLGKPFVRNIAEFDSAIGSADFNCSRDMLGVGESSGRVTFLDWHGPLEGGELRKFQLPQAVVEGTGNEGIMAARELLASGRVEIREHHGLRSVFAV